MLKREKLEVVNTYWWHGLPRYNRPLLVLTTESSPTSPATVQIWNTARGAGIRIFRSDINHLEVNSTRDSDSTDFSTKLIQFARGIAQVSSGQCGQPIFCGASNGALYGIHFKPGRDGGFKPTSVIRDLTHATTMLVADKRGSDYLGGADESGKLLVWNIELDKGQGGKESNHYKSTVIYEYCAEEDLLSSLGLRGSVVFAGHSSGYLTVHDIKCGRPMASIVTNTKAVTCIDVYHDKDLVLVCGEDCRVTVIGFSQARSNKPVVHFSVALDTIVVGCAFLTSPKGYPRIILLTWEGCSLIQYDYERSNKRDKARAIKAGMQYEKERAPNSPQVMCQGKGLCSAGPESLSNNGECLVSPAGNPLRPGC